MKIPLIKGHKKHDGTYHFFLPDRGQSRNGVTLAEEDFVTAFLQRIDESSTPRCADPRCNAEFNPVRHDQIYHTHECGKRHRARMQYRHDNGLPDDVPVVRDFQGRLAAEHDLRESLRLTKLEIDRRPPTYNELLPDGTAMSRVESTRVRDARERQKTCHVGDALRIALHPLGYVLGDFADDELNVLFAEFEASGRTPPTPERCVELRCEEFYSRRQEDLAEAARQRAENVRRCAQLYPDMDRVQADGSVSP